MQKLLKAQYIMNKMHEYEIKSFSKKKKHLNSTQIFQKQVFQPICLKNSNIKDICIKIQEHVILDDHNKITHNIMYQV